MTTDSLTIFTRAAAMLVEADTIQKARELKDLALTAAEWARRKGMGEAAVWHCKSYALEAERKMGQMLAGAEKAKGRAGPGRGKAAHEAGAAFNDAPTLAELGLSDNESVEAQLLAQVDKETFDQVCAGKITKTAALAKVKREKRIEQLRETTWPSGQFRVIYADPPWSYSDTRATGGPTGGAATIYDTMSLEAICQLPVSGLALFPSVLFLWIPSPLLPDGLTVLNGWGFVYKSLFVWDKLRGYFGHYNNVRHEFLLLGTKGSCLPETSTLVDSVIAIERSERHSEKPKQFTDLIDLLYPSGPRVELFARTRRDGWEAYGNQLN